MALDVTSRPDRLQTRQVGTVLITGGASGLGRATADAIAGAAGTPLIIDRVSTGTPYGGLTVDIADTHAAHEAVSNLVKEQPVDAVVTAAGIDVPGTLVDVTRLDWERVVGVNLLGTVAVIRAALPCLVERQGRIVVVASTLAHRGVSDATAYCASKFGVIGFARALTAELKGRVGVTILTPGGMQTAFFDGRPAQYRPGPDADLCDPADVAAAIVFALSSPPGCEVKEMVLAHPCEPSWP